jgi:hypothetical protein
MRRAMDTALRMVASSSGNSLRARGETEYTEAPASETTTLIGAFSIC